MSNEKYIFVNTHTRDGDHEYSNQVLCYTTMTYDQLDKQDWELSFLDWEFSVGWIFKDVYTGDFEFWSGERIVSIENYTKVNKEDVPTLLNNGIYSFDLDDIVEEGKNCGHLQDILDSAIKDYERAKQGEVA